MMQQQQQRAQVQSRLRVQIPRIVTTVPNSSGQLSRQSSALSSTHVLPGVPMVPELELTPTSMAPNRTPSEQTKRLGHFAANALASLFAGTPMTKSNSNQQQLASPDIATLSTTSTASPSELMALRTFCQRLLGVTKLGMSACIFSLNLADRFITRHRPSPQSLLTSGPRLFLTGLMLANKMCDDATYMNHTWASVTQRPVRDINRMERELLAALGWKLDFGAEAYARWTTSYRRFIMEHYPQAVYLSPNDAAMMMVGGGGRQPMQFVPTVSPSSHRQQAFFTGNPLSPSPFVNLSAPTEVALSEGQVAKQVTMASTCSPVEDVNGAVNSMASNRISAAGAKRQRD